MTLRTIGAHEAKRLIEDGAILVDIREGDEHAREHIPGVRHLALSTLDFCTVQIQDCGDR